MDLTPFLPGTIAATLVGLLVGGVSGWALGVRPLMASALAVSVGVILAATLTPGGDGPHVGGVLGVCDLTRTSPARLDELLTFGEVGLNVLLFVPLGLSIGLMAPSGRQLFAIAFAASLPFLVEAVQLVVVRLGRYCDSADIVDNLTGLVLGLAAGALLRQLGRWVNGR